MKHKVLTFRVILALVLVLMLSLTGVAGAQEPGPNDPPSTEPAAPPEPVESPVSSEPVLTSAVTPGVEPKTVSGLLLLGESVTITTNKTVTTPIIPPKPDIYFLADTTGSMGGAIVNVKNNAATILATVAAVQSDAQFGAGNYKDFPHDPYAFQNNASIDGQGPALTAIDNWVAAVGGGYDGSEAQLYALDKIADDVVGWRTDSTKIVVWFGDWPGHDPVCSAISGLAYDITEASVTEKLVAADIQVIAISVTTNYPGSGCDLCDLDGDPTLDAGDYSPTCSTISGTADQAGRIAAATGGVHFSNVDPVDVSDAILDGLTNLPATVTPQLTACSGELDFVFTPASQTVTSGNAALFVETVTITDATGGIKTCTVDWLINGVDAGEDFEQSIMLVVYDPDAGFVTGGGWIESPPGAYYPMDLTFFDGSYYELGFADPPVIWDVARDLASSMEIEACESAHLATVTSQEEQDVISGLMEPTTENGWLGGFQPADEMSLAENWQWITGEPFVYTNWDGGEPNDTPAVTYIAGSEQYLETYQGSGVWNDAPVEPKHYYIIEYDDCPTGKANFGFVSKYKKGATIPDGNTEFQFHAGDLNFHSSSYDWLVVTGSNYAMFKGVGTINGEGVYKFRIWAGDDDPDTFRIKIWTEDGFGVETVIYDNGHDQEIGGGSIVIHTKKK